MIPLVAQRLELIVGQAMVVDGLEVLGLSDEGTLVDWPM